MDTTEPQPSTKRKHRILGAAVGIALLLALATSVALRSRSGAPGAAASLAARTVTVGSIEIAVQPLQLDESGARFQVGLTTHGGDLDMTPRGRLQVADLAWAGGTWTGDPPGGHHRSGVLAFSSPGAAKGTATLTIEGFAQPVAVSWDI